MGGELVKFHLGREEVSLSHSFGLKKCHKCPILIWHKSPFRSSTSLKHCYASICILLAIWLGSWTSYVRRWRRSVYFWRSSLCCWGGRWCHLSSVKLLTPILKRWKGKMKAGWWTLSTSHQTTPPPGSSGMPGTYLILPFQSSYWPVSLSFVICYPHQGPFQGGHCAPPPKGSLWSPWPLAGKGVFRLQAKSELMIHSTFVFSLTQALQNSKLTISLKWQWWCSHCGSNEVIFLDWTVNRNSLGFPTEKQ